MAFFVLHLPEATLKDGGVRGGYVVGEYDKREDAEALAEKYGPMFPNERVLVVASAPVKSVK